MPSFSRSTSYSCNVLHGKSFANILGQQPMKSLKNVPRLHTILEIRKLLYQTYVLSSPCKIDIASRRFCSQLMVGSRSQCQVQRKATKGKPALPTPVRHTEGAKCCFERFIIETITYDIVSGASLPLKRIMEDKNLSETAFNPFSSIFCLWALALLPSFSPPPLQQDLPFHLVSS